MDPMNFDNMVMECRNADVVVTKGGAGILIAGNVIDVAGPTDYGTPIQWAKIIATALRRSRLHEAVANAAAMDNHFREELAKAANARQ
jgi:hypothetical protein